MLYRSTVKLRFLIGLALAISLAMLVVIDTDHFVTHDIGALGRKHAQSSVLPHTTTVRLKSVLTSLNKPTQDQAWLESASAAQTSERIVELPAGLGLAALEQMSKEKLVLYAARMEQQSLELAHAVTELQTEVERLAACELSQPRAADTHPGGLGVDSNTTSGFYAGGLQEKRRGCPAVDLPPHCAAAFTRCGIRAVALVGNGPLTDAQRAELNGGRYDIIIRYNLLNNRLPGERMDVWVMRHAFSSKLHFWGLVQMDQQEALEALNATAAIWFLGTKKTLDSAWYMLEPTYRAFPQVKEIPHALLDYSAYYRHYVEVTNSSGSPSSGHFGIMYALECAQPLNASVHLFGYNWNEQNGDSHAIATDEYYARVLEANGTIVIHSTGCGGYRTCRGFDVRDCKIREVNGTQQYVCVDNDGNVKTLRDESKRPSVLRKKLKKLGQVRLQ